MRPLLPLVLAASLAAQDAPHVHTDRPRGAHLIPEPTGEDAFVFAIFGDRTGGRPAGLQVLEQAVADVNLIDPDFVMTVGDMIQGYNETPQWLGQMEEYKGYMAALRMPWYPVAGNHDTYYRGEDRPRTHHDRNYERHFGPLWYAFEHRDCWFVALYSDEGDPGTGRKGFNDPDLQRMSPEQLAWLDGTLDAAAEARHVFVFLHHPRWLGGGYGDHWQEVHDRLAAAGNVSAVFAGHIHRMRYDGERDGIEYFALATTGGGQGRDLPEAGYLHHFHVVTVRGDRVSAATIPVGAVLDPREITGEISDEVARLDDTLAPRHVHGLRLRGDGRTDGLLRMAFRNPTGRPIELEVTPGVGDRRWTFRPDHEHAVVPAGEAHELVFRADREPGPLGSFREPRVRIRCDYLAPHTRISLPPRTVPVPVDAPRDLADLAGERDGHGVFDGESALRLGTAATDLPDGPITVEAWIRGDDYRGRRGLATRTEHSEYGLFVSDGRPAFSVHLDGRYVTARTGQPVLETGVWHHVAGTFDGRTVRVHVDGRTVARAAGEGERTRNRLPFHVGADVDRHGRPTSFFRGAIDELRISAAARYGDEDFQPLRRLPADGATAVLLHLDAVLGPWVPDHSGRARHARVVGTVPVRPHGDGD